MSELTLLVLKLGFLVLLWVFVFMIVYALRSDLFGPRARRLPASETPAPPLPAPAPAPAPVAAGSPVAASLPTAPIGSDQPATASRLVITSGAKEGLEVPLTDEQLTIGRSSESGLVIRDDYTSTHHARLLRWKGEWMLEDLGSTNGTFIGGNRVTSPTAVPLNTPVKIGTTTFELRR
ncbi:FHA domain-containing protein FhaB/FipA [Ruicaihuangia caeni]|uniref:FHA domain-containing protein n=1 Tax=Ruicaihuangia caeni TaxID=3042517 RepID=A0AAW6T8S0_9MICO|nr:FHA domain-containing protein [Klugiella sp. YN-L-19]MDI2099161.1 FHA domain-containing protein [Klugiella sp. YN-L-19]